MIQAICWTLIHSLWQGLLFAMITGLVMLVTRRASAAVRYNILCVLFFLFLGVCAGTFIYERTLSLPVTMAGDELSGAGGGGRVSEWIAALGMFCSEHALFIVWVWLFVVAVKSLHMFGSFLYIQRVRHYGLRAASADWQERIDELCRQMGIRRAVRLVESQIAKMPMVIGHWRPMVFIPLGLIAGLPEKEIEAVLLHELAHIRRHDYIVNFLQGAAVNLLFFNPGFLWMSALLREERENCCDDIAIARTHDRAGFIRALISFKEHDLRLAGLANTFPAGKNQLVKRVMRIAQNTNKTLDPIEKIFLVVSFVLISLLVAVTTGGSPKAPAPIAQVPGGNYRVFIDTPAIVDRGLLNNKNVGMPGDGVVMSMPEIPLPVKDRVKPVRKIGVSPRKHVLPMNQEEIYAADAPRMEEKRKLEEMEAKASDAVGNESTSDNEQKELDAKQALRDKELAKLDAIQAKRDVDQAIMDKLQALRDAQMAYHDRQQAERDAKQAIKDKEQADRDLIQAGRDKGQADKRKKEPISEKKPISP